MADYQRRHQQDQQQIQQRPGDAMKGLMPERGPSTQQILAVITLLPLGGFLLLLAGVTFAGTLLGLAVATPVFVIFSPVIVPAALAIGMAVAGFLTSGAFGVTGLSSLSWLANYARRMNLRAAPEHAAEMARRRVQETAGYLGQKTREAGETIQSKAQDVGGRAQDAGGRGQEGTNKPVEVKRT